jgi:hypothetical protein
VLQKTKKHGIVDGSALLSVLSLAVEETGHDFVPTTAAPCVVTATALSADVRGMWDRSVADSVLDASGAVRLRSLDVAVNPALLALVHALPHMQAIGAVATSPTAPAAGEGEVRPLADEMADLARERVRLSLQRRSVSRAPALRCASPLPPSVRVCVRVLLNRNAWIRQMMDRTAFMSRLASVR